MSHGGLKREGDLECRIALATRGALSRGRLESIQTASRVVVDQAIPFVVRWTSVLRHKPSGLGSGAPSNPNPFLPPEKDLVVSMIPPAHLAVLNKYNVIDRHLLVVTRRFERQEQLLTPDDFNAARYCLTRMDGLVFYNGGIDAGASQPHKHLQWVPRTLGARGSDIPLTVLIKRMRKTASRVPGLPFVHAFQFLRTGTRNGALPNGKMLYRLYRALLARCGLNPETDPVTHPQAAPYNLLITRQWIMLIPRQRDSVHGISINALGFAGSFFLKEPDLFETVRQEGPARLLSIAGYPTVAALQSGGRERER